MTKHTISAATDIEAMVQEYLRLFPYQETYRYAMLQTGGDPAKLNTWVDTPRGLLKAGEDKVVRSNNDTVYRMAWVYLGKGPVVLTSAAPSKFNGKIDNVHVKYVAAK